MATLDNLVAIYRNVNRLSASADLSADAIAQITLMAQGIDAARNGMVGDLWTYASAVSWIQDSAKATTQVAVMSYGFLADLTLSNLGVDYLVSPNGGNPNNLNSAYYANFNLENRFINFAVSLVKHGEAKQNFIDAYGASGTAYDTFRKAYAKLFGAEKSIDDVIQILSAEIPNGRGGTYTRGEYFAEIGGDGGNGLGTRAAMVGWLMAEAVKADKGPYVDAVQAYLADIGIDGKAAALPVFRSAYGAGGDYAKGGPSDPGLPGERASYAHDWNVDVSKVDGQDVHVLATDGNDTLKPIVADQGGLDAGRYIRTGGGNDVVHADNGPMRGHIDTETGNDIIFVEQFDGRITTGDGYDSVDVGSFAGLHMTGGKVSDIAVIEDFQKGRDLLSFAGVVGPGEKKQLFFITTATFDEALTAYAGMTAANCNTVFEWNGDTYVFHQNGVAGLDAGDGLIKLAGVTSLSVGRANGAEDILFAA